MTASRSVLSVRDLSFRRANASDGFSVKLSSLDLQAGDRLSLIGPSGSGKSTLLDLIALALRPDQASTFQIDGMEVMKLWASRNHNALAAMRGRVMGYVLQTGGLLSFLSVRKNIELAGRLSGRVDSRRLKLLTQRLGIDHLLNKKPPQLSVGERQRVSIARALIHGPKILFADEPTASVDPATATEIMRLMTEVADREEVAMLIASHDHELVKRFGIQPLTLEIAHDRSGSVSTFGHLDGARTAS